MKKTSNWETLGIFCEKLAEDKNSKKFPAVINTIKIRKKLLVCVWPGGYEVMAKIRQNLEMQKMVFTA